MAVNLSENTIGFSGKNKNEKTKNKGIIRGVLVADMASIPVQVASSALLVPGMKKIVSSLNADEVQIVNKAFDNAVEKSGILQKGAKVWRMGDEKTTKKLTEELVNVTLDSKVGKFLQNIVGKKNIGPLKTGMEIKYQALLNMVKNGDNAFYVPLANSLALPEKGKGLQLSTFHELGHAMNKNFGKFSKFLQNTRGPIQMFGGLAVLLTAITLKDKANAVDENGEKKKGVRQFVKNNVGVLASLTMLPAVLEEGLASFKGNKLAKEALGNAPKLLKKVKATNALGFASYVLLAAATGIGAHLAIKVKDNIQEEYELKQKMKAEGKV